MKGEVMIIDSQSFVNTVFLPFLYGAASFNKPES